MLIELFLLIILLILIFIPAFTMLMLMSWDKDTAKVYNFWFVFSYWGLSYILFITSLLAGVMLFFWGFDKFFYWMFKNQLISATLSLSLTLLIVAYFPNKLGELSAFLIRKIFRKVPAEIVNDWVNSIKSFNFKQWVYLLSFLLSIAAVFDETHNYFGFWLKLKPVVFNSVVIFIAFDRFFTEFKKSLKADLNKTRDVLNRLEVLKKD